MRNRIKMIILISTLFCFFTLHPSHSQTRDYLIHNRGMLHETVFNTGEIGRGWMTGDAGNKTNVPVFEWPSRSATKVEGIEYSGQHNILGAGMYMAANIKGVPGKNNRIYALCGGVGASSPEVVFGRWSFPVSMKKIENFPVLENGDLNPAYDPNEAEEIIIAKWSSSVGVTVTRTSRAWSYPDYDDMIIYEYELEYTGDTDGNPATIEMTEELRDFMALFIYGFAPSMYGYQRHYQEWKYDGGIYRGDQNGFWDADYWLAFNLDRRTALDENLAGKPEPNKELFRLYSETGENGGGLCSPQAPGYVMLYYDVNHLAKVIPAELDSMGENESEAAQIMSTNLGEYFELDNNWHVKQPWSNMVSSGNTRSSKMEDLSINPDYRWSGIYTPNSTTWPEPPSDRWIGRGAYPYNQSNDAGQKHTVFGPYTLKPGDKLRYALAEVVGYGAQPGKRIEGGQVTQQWSNTPTWNCKIVLYGEVMTENYLDDYGYPDYVNSEVINVTQVAHKAFEAYLGHEPEVPVWPEDNPETGNYAIPVPVPAPAIVVENTDDGQVKLTWKRSVENFEHPLLMGQLDKFEIQRSDAGMGPWKVIGTFSVGQGLNSENLYEFIDDDENYKNGEKKYYTVVSVDEYGNCSGKTNITSHLKIITQVVNKKSTLSVKRPQISNFPNPFNPSTTISYDLNKTGNVELVIYNIVGQKISTLVNKQQQLGQYQIVWDGRDENGNMVSSGIYLFKLKAEGFSQTKEMMFLQ